MSGYPTMSVLRDGMSRDVRGTCRFFLGKVDWYDSHSLESLLST